MRIGIKYCGGCNSRYDRKKFIDRLLDEIDNISIELADKNNYYDLILVICGCFSACPEHELIKGKEKMIVVSENEYTKVKTKILQMCKFV
ncbi:hypothetical protein [Sedimentibacter sp. MB31-C6]|uniref:hypothetical protein n=1 Tax=Sedimentibacter sp. MB31-C6 TaxID=3109366 RepID=UPI002DDC8FD3|nr:hypothetical protein [Sedimentibacter sp. MB36-C1]WSI04881.1 hypothetical protein U8307_03580 [Sedimentibacter sp. MB36-C1]